MFPNLVVKSCWFLKRDCLSSNSYFQISYGKFIACGIGSSSDVFVPWCRWAVSTAGSFHSLRAVGAEECVQGFQCLFQDLTCPHRHSLIAYIMMLTMQTAQVASSNCKQSISVVLLPGQFSGSIPLADHSIVSGHLSGWEKSALFANSKLHGSIWLSP